MIDLRQGDCKEVLKSLPDNSVDSIVTDPPYELGFMGKSWDSTGIANDATMWSECLRVLKPGGHLLAFSGTRTYHRMASAIEDAGFEVRDMIEWVYGSGFPKSLSIGKAVNSLEIKEWSKIGKCFDNIEKSCIFALWKNNLNNVKFAETLSEKSQTEIGICIPTSVSVQENVVENINQENYDLIVSFAEQNLNEARATNTKTNTVLQNVEAEIRQLQNLVKFAGQLQPSQNHKSWNIFTAQCNVKEWLNENTEVNLKVEKALKTLRGNKKYSNEEITNVLCVALTEILKLTILNQSKIFQNLGTTQKMECVSAINVIITEYTAENLISNTVDILKSKAVDKIQGNEREEFIRNDGAGTSVSGKKTIYGSGLSKADNGTSEFIDTKGTSEWEGWGTQLKPAHEPICMARKPLSEKTIAENCLKWGTGGINIDECRVDTITEKDKNNFHQNRKVVKEYKADDTLYELGMNTVSTAENQLGRFPANLIHDNSEEVRECFPDSKAGSYKGEGSKSGGIWSESTGKPAGMEYGDSGNASRFFKSIIYQPKASKAERNKGCEGLEEKQFGFSGGANGSIDRGDDYDNGQEIGLNRISKMKNNHPTVKPVKLMEYLIEMVTPKNGTVLEPFMGSGTTGIAAVNLNRNFIGIELDAGYFEIAKKRIDSIKQINQLELFAI